LALLALSLIVIPSLSRTPSLPIQRTPSPSAGVSTVSPAGPFPYSSSGAQAANRASISSIPEASFVAQAGDRKRQRQREKSRKHPRPGSATLLVYYLHITIIPSSRSIAVRSSGIVGLRSCLVVVPASAAANCCLFRLLLKDLPSSCPSCPGAVCYPWRPVCQSS
jgi:hypothetical protein